LRRNRIQKFIVLHPGKFEQGLTVVKIEKRKPSQPNGPQGNKKTYFPKPHGPNCKNSLTYLATVPPHAATGNLDCPHSPTPDHGIASRRTH
jgi:hypothetical protein